ncbi:MAG: hypothetical protein ACKOA4_10465 [Haliscomenobacter sp.]
MTLQELLQHIGENPVYILSYFAALPAIALLTGRLDGERGHGNPWRYIYSGIIYLSAVPGLFALTLNIYLFLFEKRSILDMDVLTQLLPIASLVLTLSIVRRNVDLEYVPGFDKLSGLLLLISGLLGLMWLADRTHVVAFFQMRFEVVLLIFVVLLLLLRFGFRKVFG